MKRSAVLMLTTLTLLAGLADAARRSGGGFGGSRSSGGTYNSPRTPSYNPPRNSSSGSRYTTPNQVPATPKTNLPSTASVRSSPLNTSAAARVTPTQLGNWNKLSLPAGVPRSAVTYSAAPSSGYRYQLQPGRYFPYPQSYYRQHGIGYDILKYALIFTAVSSVAHAMTPDVVVTQPVSVNGNAPVVVQQSGPNLWTYAGVGFLAAAAGWFVLGRKRG